MQVKSVVAPALKALLENFIDYAGIFPPAALKLDEALVNFGKYESENYSWMLRWLVVGSGELSGIPQGLDGKLSVISEIDEARAATLETKSIVKAARPVYCEVATSNLSELEKVKQSGCFGKIRTGGLKPEAIPSTLEVAAFILKCAELRLAFKATAGLHHPIRAEYPLTYATDAPRAVMHGFLNVLMASVFAWQGEKDIEAILAETDPKSFTFDDKANWRHLSATVEQVKDARSNFIHSVGSCSFNEPVHELQALGLLP